MSRPLDKYAKRQREIRSLQPKVTSDTAYARARKALEAAGQPTPSRLKGAKSSTGPRAEGRLIDPRFLERLWNVGGVEHDVFHCAETGRWVKFTLPGKGGKMIAAQSEGAGLPGRLVTEDAPPFVSLRRLTLANSRLGDDLWLHGVVPDPAGPERMVVSQRDIGGEPASYETIALHFGLHGFVPVNQKTFYHAGENLLVSDAHPGNVFRARQDVIAFDVCVQRPEGRLREAVQPHEALDFEGAPEQKALRF